MTLDWKIAISALIGVCVAAGLVIGVDELLRLRARGKLDRSRVREMLMSLSPLPVNIVVTLGLSGLWAELYEQAHALSLHRFPVNGWTMAVALLAVDFSYYWEHRCAHRLTWLWNLYHAVHHSSADYTIATAYRVSCINQMLSPAFYVPWVLLGFHPLLIVGWQLVAFHYQAWLHSETIGTLGVLDRWFNTPATHRVHHSAALEHRDRNLGAITLLWDRMLGTYAPPAENLTYGIPGAVPPTTIAGLYLDPWRRAVAARDPMGRVPSLPRSCDHSA